MRIRRDNACALLRAVGDGGNVIEGYPIVFGQRSVLLPDYNKWKMVYEVIEPGAVSDDLLRGSDVIANLEHNDAWLLARMVNGDGSLSMEVDERGVRASFEVADTPWGQQALSGVRRRDYRGMSFAFSVNEDEDVTYSEESDDDGGKVLVRHVHRLRGLYDVSIVAHPAYQQTSVEARSLLDGVEGLAGEPEKVDDSSERMREDVLRLFEELRG